MHAFDILTYSPGYTKSLDSFFALFPQCLHFKVLPYGETLQREKRESKKQCELNSCWASLCILVPVEPPLTCASLQSPAVYPVVISSPVQLLLLMLATARLLGMFIDFPELGVFLGLVLFFNVSDV